MTCLYTALFLNSVLLTCFQTPLTIAADAPPTHRQWTVAEEARKLTDFPASSALRKRLEGLSPEARDRALKWLSDMTFCEHDFDSIRVDQQGGVLYACAFAMGTNDTNPEHAPADLAEAAVAVNPFPTALNRHSRPGATKVLYLDFNGTTVTGTAWNTEIGRDPIVARAYSTDSDASTFSDAEQAAILAIWRRVAEDFAPYDVDVTTEEPAQITRNTAHCVITRNTDIGGAPNPFSGAGGVAYVNVFGIRDFTFYSPAWVYHNNLGNRENNIAEAASHELGHNLGLSHDGKTDGTEYYAGHGSGVVRWSTIMGVGYNAHVTQWSRGEYTGANNSEDDLAIIAAKVGYRGDDHGNTVAGASFLTITNGTQIVGTTRATDPENLLPGNKGVIETGSDTDVFAFAHGDGPLDILVQPEYEPNGYRGGNLDVEAALLDAAGTPLFTVNPVDEVSARVSTNLQAGVYYLHIRGVGQGQPLAPSPTGYTAYGSIGSYTLNGTITQPDNVPTPPQAAVSVEDLTDIDVTLHPLTVTYTDNLAVDGSTLGAGDIRITGPGGVLLDALFDSVTPAGDGSPLKTTYQVPPPSGTVWTGAHNGTYSIAVVSNAVSDIEGTGIAETLLGTFTVTVPGLTYLADMDTDPGWQFSGAWDWGIPLGASGDPSSGSDGPRVVGYNLAGAYTKNLVPTAAVTPPIDCSEASVVSLHFMRWLRVLRNDTAGIDVSTDGGNSWTPLWSNAGTLLDTAWSKVSYDLTTLAAGQPDLRIRWTMASNRDPKVDGGWNLDSVQVLSDGAVIDTTPPAATLNAVTLTTTGGPLYEFSVTYTDAVAVAYASLGTNDVVVVDPAGITNSVELAGVDLAEDAPRLQATYRLFAPAGGWSMEDNGSYTVWQEPDAVEDSNRNAAPPGALGAFAIDIQPPRPEIIVSPLDLAVPEGGSSAFEVSLDEDPGAPVTVHLRSIPGGDPDLTPASNTLTFTSGNWSVPQPVPVSAADDVDTDAGIHLFALDLVNANSVTVTVAEVERPLVLLTVSADPALLGTVSTTGAWVQVRSEVTVSATPGTYNVFTGWSGSLVTTETPLTLTLTNTTTLTAGFAEGMTTTHPTPWSWLGQFGFLEDFEQAAEGTGANGIPRWQSYVAGLDPTDPRSRFTLQVQQGSDDTERLLQWPAISNRWYSVYRADDLSGPFSLHPLGIGLPGPDGVFTDTVFQTGTRLYYRVEVDLTPPAE